ncbi:GNAT family N-acetyltransferase [Kitasatospora sp. NPDC054939]
MSGAELRRITAFLAGFARRQADRTVELPGGFAVFNDEFPTSWADNQVHVDRTDVDPAALPELVDRALAERPFRFVTVLDGDFGDACAEPFERAGYTRSTYLVMLHTGPLPPLAPAHRAADVPLDAFRGPLAASWRSYLPEADDATVRALVDRREVRRRGAEQVRFLGARTAAGEVAAWADLYLQPGDGVAQFEDLMTDPAQRRRGHADTVLGTALHLAAEADCGTRFLTAESDDWPRGWYERRGFTAVGRTHCFHRT